MDKRWGAGEMCKLKETWKTCQSITMYRHCVDPTQQTGKKKKVWIYETISNVNTIVNMGVIVYLDLYLSQAHSELFMVEIIG